MRFVKNMARKVKKWWKDDSGTGMDQHSTNFLYVVIGLAVGTILLTGVGYVLHNKAVGIGTDISGFEVTVPDIGTGGFEDLSTVTFGEGDSTINGAEFE
ncbi:hypothetical protein [Desulfoscipio gibsoniae]